jgi:hypothetical protein
MCYASPVMLRGRCSCAISIRPTPLPRAIFAKGEAPFVSSSLFRMLSPIIPLHPRNYTVTPLFPLLTQKQGVGGTFSCLFCLVHIFLRPHSPPPHFLQRLPPSRRNPPAFNTCAIPPPNPSAINTCTSASFQATYNPCSSHTCKPRFP